MAGEKVGPEAELPVGLQELSTRFALAVTGADRAAVFYELLGVAVEAIQNEQDADQVVKQYKDEASTAQHGVVEAEARVRKAEGAAASLARDKEELQTRLTNSGVTNQRLARENQELRGGRIEQRATNDRLEGILNDPEQLLRELVRNGTITLAARLEDETRVWAEPSKSGHIVGVYIQEESGLVTLGIEEPGMRRTVRLITSRTPLQDQG